MALITCTNCGHMISDKAEKCPKCGTPIQMIKEAANPIEKEENVTEKGIELDAGTPRSSSGVSQKSKQNNGLLIGVIVLLLLIICGVGGYLYYDNIYLPEKIDREAPRYYSMANVIVLRSSRSAGADFNKVASLPYGTELITYEHDSEWSRVKVNSLSGDKQEGYVASQYILKKSDFSIENRRFLITY